MEGCASAGFPAFSLLCFCISFQHGKGLSIISVKLNELSEKRRMLKYSRFYKSEIVTVHTSIHAHYSFRFQLYTDFITKNVFAKYFKEKQIR